MVVAGGAAGRGAHPEASALVQREVPVVPPPRPARATARARPRSAAAVGVLGDCPQATARGVQGARPGTG